MPSCTTSCMYRQCIPIPAYQRSNFNVFSLSTIPNMTIFGIVATCRMYKYTAFLGYYPDIYQYFIHIIHEYGMFILLFLPFGVLLNQLICGRFVCQLWLDFSIDVFLLVCPVTPVFQTEDSHSFFVFSKARALCQAVRKHVNVRFFNFGKIPIYSVVDRSCANLQISCEIGLRRIYAVLVHSYVLYKVIEAVY